MFIFTNFLNAGEEMTNTNPLYINVIDIFYVLLVLAAQHVEQKVNNYHYLRDIISPHNIFINFNLTGQKKVCFFTSMRI